MRIIHLSVVVAILVLLFSPTTHRAAGADAPAASQNPQVLQIARWDAMLNDVGLDTVRQNNPTPVETPSKLYQAMKFDAAALRAAIAQAKDTKGLFAPTRNMNVSQDQGGGNIWMQPSFFTSSFTSADTAAGLQGNIQGSETDRKTDADHLHLQFNYSQFNLRLLQRRGRGLTSTPANVAASIQFDGSLAAGEAIAFLGDYKTADGLTLHHLLVWEVFKRPENRAAFYQNINDPEWWCDNGPEGLEAAIDTAQVWAAAAPQNPPAPDAAMQKTEDGKTVRLLGLMRMDKWPFCWWDAQGHPIDRQEMVSLSSTNGQPRLWCSIEVQGAASEWKLQTPTGNSNMGSTGTYQANQVFQSSNPTQLQIGIPVGSWEKVGDVAPGASIDVEGTTWQLRPINNNRGQGFNAQFLPSDRSATPDFSVTLIAEDNHGTLHDTNYNQRIYSPNSGITIPYFQDLSPDNVKAFHVWKRKIQWITFDNLMAEPPTPPKTDVTPEQVAAAQTIYLQRHPPPVGGQFSGQAQPPPARSLAERKRDFDAVSPDTGTAMGTLRTIDLAAQKGDLPSVRRRMFASTPEGNQYLDLIAQLITDQIFIRTQLVQRYTQAKIDALPSSDPLFVPDTQRMFLVDWVQKPDGEITYGNTTVGKGLLGFYFLSFRDNIPRGVPIEDRFKPAIAKLEKLKKLLADNPNMTLDQLETAARSAAAGA